MKKYADAKEEKTMQINMLKDNYKRAYDYYRELFKHDYPEQTIQGKKQYRFTNTEYPLESSNYYFFTFNTLDIGEHVALSKDDNIIIEGLHIEYCKFYNCNINNVTFRNCSFSGSQFKEVNFRNVIFEKCIFSVPLIEKDHHEVDDLYYVPTIFEKCFFVSDFFECYIDNSLFERSNFTLTKFQKASLQHSIMNKCVITDMEMKDCDLKDLSIVNTDIMDISFNDDLSTSVDESTFIDYGIKTKRKNIGKRNDAGWIADNYDVMCMDKSKTIKSFAKLFAKNGYSDIEGEYFYSSKRIELKALHGIDKFKSISALVLCGYGERPSFTFLTILVSSLLFAIIYMFSGVNAGGESIKYSLIGGEQMPAIKVICDYGKCLFFSITTFSTVGYGNYVPLGICSMFVSGLHMFVGVSLCALWTGCIFRKISR